MSKFAAIITAEWAANRDRFKLWFPVLFALGIGLYFLPETEPSKWLTLGMIEALILLAVLLRHYPAALKMLLALACVLAGFADIQIQSIYRESRQRADLPQQAIYVRGQIADADYNIKGNRRLVFEKLEDFDGYELNGRFRITLRGRYEELKIGDCVEMVARIQPPSLPVIPGGYQFDRKLFYDGYSGSGYALSFVYQTDCAGKRPARENFFDTWRQQINQKITRLLPEDEAAVAAALITGERGLISERLTNAYRDSGLAHFLSISGLHMSMIAGLMFFLARLLLACIPALSLRFDSKKISAVLAIIVSAVYLGLSGMEIPAVRAFIMTLIVLLGVLFNRRAISMYTIAVAATIILAVCPQALISASFQMSFAAVVCLIAFYERCAGWLNHFIDKSAGSLPVRILKILLLYFVGVLVTDFIASMATLPFAVYHFNRVVLYTSLANLLSAPVIGFVIMPFVLLALLLMPLGLADLPLRVAGFGIGCVNDITTWISSMDGAAYLILSEPLWGLLLIVFGGLWLCIWQSKIRHFGWLAVAVGGLSVAAVTKPDILINADAKVIALRDNQDNMVILPVRGKNFVKRQWLEKTASRPLDKRQADLLRQIYKGRQTDPEWLELRCTRQKCIYKHKFQIIKGRNKLLLAGKVINIGDTGGLAVYMGKALRIKTVREAVGRRLWNQN